VSSLNQLFQFFMKKYLAIGISFGQGILLSE